MYDDQAIEVKLEIGDLVYLTFDPYFSEYRIERLIPKESKIVILMQGDETFVSITNIEPVLRKCRECGTIVNKADLDYTRDSHGVTGNLVCHKCHEKIMKNGYDTQFGSYHEEVC